MSKAHFSFFIRPHILRESLESRRGCATVTAVSLPELGSVDENRGYGAADQGPITRPVTSLGFGVARSGTATVFTFEGQTGAIDLKSVYDSNHLKYLSTSEDRSIGYSFQIWFEMLDKDLPLHVVDAEALSAINEYIASAA